MSDIRPVPQDPAKMEVQGFLDMASQEWWLVDEGTVATFAAETTMKDGSDFQRVICLEIPVRRNQGEERGSLRFMVGPVDAEGLANSLLTTVDWLHALWKKEGSN